VKRWTEQQVHGAVRTPEHGILLAQVSTRDADRLTWPEIVFLLDAQRRRAEQFRLGVIGDPNIALN